MSKYKILGFFNLILGLAQILFSGFFGLLSLPKMASLYVDFNLKPNFTIAYVFILLVIVAGIGNLIFAGKLFQQKSDQEKVFKWSLIFLISSAVLFVISFPIVTLTVTSSVYNLTSDF